MITATALTPQKASNIIEAVIARGDIAQLTPEQRAKYYVSVCESMGLNPMTRPFEYIVLNNKLTLYARKECTDQLRSIYDVSITELSRSEREGVFIVTAKVSNGTGRTDMSIGAVNIQGLKGEFLANAMMKAETKAKRRATLSICGLGFLDESEVGDIPDARRPTAQELERPAPPTLPAPELKRGVGRPSKVREPEHDPETGEIAPDAGWPEPDLPPPDDAEAPDLSDPDVAAGFRDAQAGRTACLDPAIRRSEARFARWRAGYYYASGEEVTS